MLELLGTLHVIRTTTDEECESMPGLLFQGARYIPNEVASEDASTYILRHLESFRSP